MVASDTQRVPHTVPGSAGRNAREAGPVFKRATV